MRPSYPFKPHTPSISLSVTSSSGSVAIPASKPTQVRLSTDGGDSVCYVKFGDSSVTAASDGTDMRIGPGTIEIFSVPYYQGVTHVAAKTASGTATLYITGGEGA
jgi:hypothetical protein